MLLFKFENNVRTIKLVFNLKKCCWILILLFNVVHKIAVKMKITILQNDIHKLLNYVVRLENQYLHKVDFLSFRQSVCTCVKIKNYCTCCIGGS